MVTPLHVGPHVARADAAGDAEHPIAPDQQAVLDIDASAVRVTAPAGSGKTRTMVEWAVDRARRLDPAGDQRVLAVSFTNRSTADLQVRVASALVRAGLPTDLVWVCTFHSFAMHVIGEFGHHLGLPSVERLRLIGDADATALVETLLADTELEHMDASTPDTVVTNLLQLDSALCDHHLDVQEAIDWHEQRLADYDANRGAVDALPTKAARGPCEIARATTAERLDLLRLVEPYRALKRDRGVLDYGDQMSLAVRLAGIDEVRDELRRRMPYVIVDEYQDTNVAQRRLVQRLATKLVVVGDDAQAIYSFRGATLDNFSSFPHHFPGGFDAYLQRVYRHGPEVVRLAEAVARGSASWRDRTTDARGGPSSVQLVEFADQAQEADWIAVHVASLVGDDPRDVAVLAPQRRFLVPIAMRLEEHGIPVEAPGLGSLLDSPTFHTVHALLRIAHDPGDSIAAARLLRCPRYRLGPHDIVSFVEAADRVARHERREARLEWTEDVGVRLLDGLLDASAVVSDEVRVRVERFLEDVRRWVALARMLPLADFAETAAAELGLVDALATAPGALAIRARSELQAAIDDAREYASVDPSAGLGGYLDHLERILKVDENIEVTPPDPSARAVRLLTIHAAKGLQFRHVIIPGVVDGALPKTSKPPDEATASGRAAIPYALRGDVRRASPRLWDPVDLAAHDAHLREVGNDESRRLFYVACTRARDTVTVTRSHWTWTAAGEPARRPCRSSYFAQLAEAGFVIEGPDGNVPDANPLGPLLMSAPPPPEPPSPLELAVAGDGDLQELLRDADATALDEIRALARRLLDAEGSARAAAPAPPLEHTVTDLVLALRCPVAYAQRRVLGLPQPISEAARRGTMVHQWIEERGWALQEGADPAAVARPWPSTGPSRRRRRTPERVVVDEDQGADAVPDDPPEPLPSDDHADTCADAWLQTPYASMTPEATELPVVLTVGGAYIRGTVDAVYRHPDGTLEVVDVKTGPIPDDDGWLQLEAYAFAVGATRLTFVSLRGPSPEVVSREWTGDPREALRAALDRVRGPYHCPGCKLCS